MARLALVATNQKCPSHQPFMSTLPKTLCDVLYDTLGEFGAIQAQAVAKIFTIELRPKSWTQHRIL